MNTSFKRENGFTLIEMIVSLALFSVVAVVALGALIKIIDANKKAQTLQAAITNLNFSLESMSRELRVASSIECVSGYSFSLAGNGSLTKTACPAGYGTDASGATLAFQSWNLDATGCRLIYAYRFRPDTNTPPHWYLEKAEQDNCSDAINNASFSSVIDPNVVVTGYQVRVSSGSYPLILVRISGYSGAAEKQSTYFDVQTAVSPRKP